MRKGLAGARSETPVGGAPWQREEKHMTTQQTTDPVLREVIQNALDTAVEEGGLAASRAAGSPFISSGGSIACAAFDRKGRQLAQTAGGLMHVAALRFMLGELLKDYALDEIADGDIFLLHDHFRGGIHPTDVGAFRPIYHHGHLVMFIATMMIVSDLGGMASGGLPANATEIFHEGLVIPLVRYYDRGTRSNAIERLIRANSRAPQKVIGDIDALVTGDNVGAARVLELLQRYGADTVLKIAEHLIAYTEQMVRLGIQAIPDGVYSGSYEIEEDGIETGRTFVVRNKVTIIGSTCHFDFTGTDRQARGPINSSLSQTWSAVIYSIRCYLDPYIPMNEGFYNVITATLPPGTLVNPNYPAACNLRMATVHAIMDSLNEAFAGVFPDRVVAAGCLAATATVSAPVGGPDGGPWTFLDVFLGVGGARQGLDGVDGTPSPIYASSGWERSIESYEWDYPAEYECLRLTCDTAGAGRWRGSAGVLKKIVFKADGWLTVRSTDRFRHAPRGMAGGSEGCTGSFVINEGTAKEEHLPPKKTNHYIHAGDRLSLLYPGGGGFGNPRERDPGAVARDVRNGRVSKEEALSVYGVTIDARGDGHRGETK
jgi:N-methylhydantoinase B